MLLLLLPGGYKRIAAENLILRRQLILAGRNRKRAPNLSVIDRFILGVLSSFISVKRLSRIGVIVKPATLLKFHKALVTFKYRLLFSKKSKGKPGPKGPSKDIINAIVEMKNRNPSFGYHRISMQINNAFGLEIDKHIVRRVLKKHHKKHFMHSV